MLASNTFLHIWYAMDGASAALYCVLVRPTRTLDTRVFVFLVVVVVLFT